MIKIARFDESKLKRYDLLDGKNPVFLDACIAEPSGFCGFEDWRPDAPSSDWWTFLYDEVHYALSGKAEITYLSPPWYTSDSKKTIVVQEGDVYLIPKGTRWFRKVIGDKPYRHLCIIMPGLKLE